MEPRPANIRSPKRPAPLFHPDHLVQGFRATALACQFETGIHHRIRRARADLDQELSQLLGISPREFRRAYSTWGKEEFCRLLAAAEAVGVDREDASADLLRPPSLLASGIHKPRGRLLRLLRLALARFETFY